MFWKFNMLTSHIDTLLEKEDVTLVELLEEDDVLQECKAQNGKLIEFLGKSKSLEKLIDYITIEPVPGTDDKVKYKYPNIACELLTADISSITDSLVSHPSLLDKIYSFMETDSKLNPLLASFFSKVLGLLITRKSKIMLTFLREKKDFVGQLLEHLETSAIMDLLLRLISCIDNEEDRNECLEWLNSQQLVQRLVNMLSPEYPSDKHSNASLSLCDIIRLNREQPPNPLRDPLLSVMFTEDLISQLLDMMLNNNEPCESVLVNGLHVVLAILDFKKPDSAESAALPDFVCCTLDALLPRLAQFQHLLLNPPLQHYQRMPTTFGVLDPPLGLSRLQICRLITGLLICDDIKINAELVSLGTMMTLLQLFFQYSWNNFLHAQVETCINTIFKNSGLLIDKPDEPAPQSKDKVEEDMEVDDEEENEVVEDETENEEKKMDIQSDEDNEETKDDAHDKVKQEETVANGGVQSDPRINISECKLLKQLICEGQLVKKLMDNWKDESASRKGYMGHLRRIANRISELQHLSLQLSEELYAEWDKFVNGQLAECNNKNKIDQTAGLQSSSEDEDPEYSLSFTTDAAIQQVFTDYQLKQMTSNFIEQYGYNSDEFAQPDDKSDPFSNKISSIDIDRPQDQSASMFEQVCNERINVLPGSEEDPWNEKEIKFAEGVSSSKHNQPTHSSDQEVIGEEEFEDEVDSEDEEDLNSPTVIRQTTEMATEKMDTNWANFDESSPKSDGDADVDNRNRSTEWPDSDDDCDDYAFLSSSGLVKGDEVAENAEKKAIATNANITNDVERARTEAVKAMKEFTSESSTNGPF